MLFNTVVTKLSASFVSLYCIQTAQLRSELSSGWQAAVIEASQCANTVVTFLMFQLSIQIKSSCVNVHEEAYGM